MRAVSGGQADLRGARGHARGARRRPRDRLDSGRPHDRAVGGRDRPSRGSAVRLGSAAAGILADVVDGFSTIGGGSAPGTDAADAPRGNRASRHPPRDPRCEHSALQSSPESRTNASCSTCAPSRPSRTTSSRRSSSSAASKFVSVTDLPPDWTAERELRLSTVLFLPRLRQVQPKPCRHPIERAPVDAEHLGRAGAVAADGVQHVQQVAALELVERRQIGEQLRRAAACWRRRH